MKKTKSQFTNVEKLLKELKKSKPKKGMDPVFAKNLKNKLREQYYLAEDEKSILDKVIEGLTAWSKMPVWGTLGAGLAVLLIVVQFGPKASIEDVKRELKIKQQKVAENIAETLPAQNSISISQTMPGKQPSGTAQNNENQTQSNTPFINITHQDKTGKSYTPVTNKDYLESPSFAEDDDSENYIDDYEGKENNINYITTPADQNYNGGGGSVGGASLADTATITLQMEIFGNLNEQISAIQTELSNLPGMENIESVVYDENTGDIEVTIAPAQIDALTDQLKTRSLDRQLGGESSLRNLDTSNVSKIRVKISIMRTPSEATSQPETITEEKEIRTTESSSTDTNNRESNVRETEPVRE